MALAVLWRLQHGDRHAARRLVRTLTFLQRSDGAWGFSFNAEGDGFYNAAYVRAGTVAWAVYAVARYRQQTGDAEVAETLRNGVTWLLQRRDPATGLLQAGQGRWVSADRFHPDDPAPFSATEHVIDAWFALRAAAVADPALAASLKLDAAAAQVARALELYLWIDTSGRYGQGMSLGRIATPRDNGSALDAAGTWSALFALQHGARQRALRMLDWVDARHATTVAGWRGLRPYAGEPPDMWFVEGSVARALALHRLGRRTAARGALQAFAALACQAGVPLPYAPTWQPDFPLAPAAAPTLWFLLAAHEIGGSEAFLWRERPTDGLGVVEPPAEDEVRVRVWHEPRR
jgi:hypothetical protein